MSLDMLWHCKTRIKLTSNPQSNVSQNFGIHQEKLITVKPSTIGLGFVADERCVGSSVWCRRLWSFCDHIWWVCCNRRLCCERNDMLHVQLTRGYLSAEEAQNNQLEVDKAYTVLLSVYRHDITQHGYVVCAAVVLVQLSIEKWRPTYSTTDYRCAFDSTMM